MPSHQSPLLHAPLGLLLLLLIGVISSHMPDVHAAPVDFWISEKNREKMMENIGIQAGCEGSVDLASSVQLPCVGVNKAEWDKTTLQQKFADVLGSLQMFQRAVEDLKNQTTEQCHSFVRELERSINNHEAIVSRRQKEFLLQNNNSTSSYSSPDVCSKKTLQHVLKQYKNLLSGKVNLLAEDLNREPTG